MRHRKRSLLVSRLIAIGSLLLVGAVIIGVTVWILVYANEPETNVDKRVSGPNKPTTDFPEKIP